MAAPDEHGGGTHALFLEGVVPAEDMLEDSPELARIDRLSVG
jgi:hypothetical protein